MNPRLRYGKTPFEYANILRDNQVDFSMFHVFYNRWEELSREDHPVVAVKQLR